MTNVINLQETAASLYNTILNLNQSATQMIGLDAVWCRLLPYDNGEDVIVQEYTLHQYECPKNIKVVSNNANFNVGNFAIDLFGIKQAEQLEISIDVTTWKSIYGEDSIPQKGDFVLIPLLHRPYEVVSSTAVHTIGQKITSWKCILGEWKHTASRKETEDFHISIDELTNAQDRLFGDTISKEVADAVNDVETAYNTTTYVDPFKESYDINSIEIDTIYGKDMNIISDAYYNFKKANKPIKYKVNATYDPKAKENKWIYSCWFKGNTNSESYSIKLKFQSKDPNYWYFNIQSKHKLEYGQNVLIQRGSQIILNGEIDKDGCESGWIVKIPASQCLASNKKFPKFWESGIWRLKEQIIYNLLSLYSSDKEILSFGIDNDLELCIKYNGNKEKIQCEDLDFSKWNYIALEIKPSELRVVISELCTDPVQKITDSIVIDETLEMQFEEFSFDYAQINNNGKEINITNIRLFENEYELDDTYKQDMYSQVVRNASKLILVDTPKPANKMSFVSPIR